MLATGGEARPPRLLSADYGEARSDPFDLGEPVQGPVWLEPFPDDGQGDADLDPAAVYARRESVELAFVASVQHLPGTQRAVLLLRDVLAFSAAETAEALGTSVASVNSALQRARATVAARHAKRSQQAELGALGDARRRALVDAFVTAWESADVPRLLELLTEDVRFTMPPLPAWFAGRADVERFLLERLFATAWRLVPTTTNGQLGFACYSLTGGRYHLAAVNVLTLRGGEVSEITGFVDPAALRPFQLPEELPPTDR